MTEKKYRKDIKYSAILITTNTYKCFNRAKTHSNLNSSNTDGSFTMANSNLFESPYENYPTAQENNYLVEFSF